jgi:hypothetical protein
VVAKVRERWAVSKQTRHAYMNAFRILVGNPERKKAH